MKVAGGRYGEYLASLPRNGSVNVIHIINVCDSLIADIKKLQKRYKNPLLGFLNVARTVASITTECLLVMLKQLLTTLKQYYKTMMKEYLMPMP